MSWTVRHDEELGVIDIRLVGAVMGPATRAIASDVIRLIAETGVKRCIVDASQQEQAASITDIYDLPNQYAEEGLDRGTCAAYVMPVAQDLKEVAVFFETVCVNRGWCVRSFGDREAALDWLLNGECA